MGVKGGEGMGRRVPEGGGGGGGELGDLLTPRVHRSVMKALFDLLVAT